MNQPKRSELSTAELEKRSKEELIKIIVQQHIQLQTLSAALSKQQTTNKDTASNRPDASKPNLRRCPVEYLLDSQSVGEWSPSDDHHNLFPPPCAAVMIGLELQQEIKELTRLVLVERQHKLEKATRSALGRLEDVGYLGRSPLLTLLAEIHQTPLDGQAVREMLRQAIADMAPEDDDPNYELGQRRHRLLQLTYLEKVLVADIKAQLALSERHYYRELKAAIQTVAANLSAR